MAARTQNKIRIIIIGAGKAGELISGNIASTNDCPFEVVGFIDDAEPKQGTKVNKHPVLGKIAHLRDIITGHAIEELFIALPSERGKTIRRIVAETSGLRVVYKILPRLSEVLLQDYKEDYLKHIRRVKPEDLLGGEILKSDQEGIAKHVVGQTIMITGAAGSIGSELSRQIVAYKPERVILYDWWENGMFDLRNQLMEFHDKVKVEYIIGDVKDRKKLKLVMESFKPTTVFHAAAYKHVPLMEYNPAEAIKNNMLGTKTVAEVAIRSKVEKFILISTDKAVNPTNIMGASKRAAEKVIHILSASQNTTSFAAVRFGNVINSNGSAIPLFEKQIEQGGPVGVTHKEMTRFFMTIPEAVHLVLQCWVIGENNDLFVLDMGEPVKIYELAELLITLHGYKPGVDIKISIIGMRPGEKLYEEVLAKEEETDATSVSKVFRTKNYLNFDRLSFIHNFNLLLESIEDQGLDITHLKQRMMQMVSTYHPKTEQAEA